MPCGLRAAGGRRARLGSARRTGRRARRRWPPGADPWPGVRAGVVVLWLPPVVRRRPPWEPSVAVDLLHRREHDARLRGAAGLFAVEFRWLPPWLGGDDTVQFASGSPGDGERMVAARCRRVARVGGGRRGAASTVPTGAGWSSSDSWRPSVWSRLVPDRRAVAMPYYWRVTLSVLVVAASGGPRTSADQCGCAGSAWNVVSRSVMVAGAQVAGVGRPPRLADVAERQMAAAWAGCAPRIPEHPVLVHALGTTQGGFDQGLIDALDRAGAPVKVDPRFGSTSAQQRTADPTDVAEIWYARGGRSLRILAVRDAARSSRGVRVAVAARGDATAQPPAHRGRRPGCAVGHDDLRRGPRQRLLLLLVRAQSSATPACRACPSSRSRRIAALNRRAGRAGCQVLGRRVPAVEAPQPDLHHRLSPPRTLVLRAAVPRRYAADSRDVRRPAGCRDCRTVEQHQSRMT